MSDGGDVYTYDGTAWSGPTTIVPDATDDDRIVDISCATSSFCVGLISSDVPTNATLYTKYNGSSWTTPVAFSDRYIDAISCPTTTFCAAVDANGGSALTFNGTQWSAPYTVPQLGFMGSVSCVSSTYCVSIATYPFNDDPPYSYAITFDGTSWNNYTAIDSIDPNADAVSCPTTSFCAAVDETANADHGGNAVTFDGTTWTLRPQIDPGGELYSVACPTSTFCLTADGQTGAALEYANGTWGQPAAIDTVGIDSVSCASVDLCIASDDNGRVLVGRPVSTGGGGTGGGGTGGGGGGTGGGGTGGGTGTSSCTSAPFPDVPTTNAFCSDIEWASSKGITKGYADGNFHPTASVSRQQIAAFLYRYVTGEGSAPACTSAPFPDVSITNPFCGEIAWLVAHKITTGYADGRFRPGVAVDRQATAAFLVRVAGLESAAAACTEQPFTDVATNNPFCADIALLDQRSVVNGFPNGSYQPVAPVSRQAMAAFLHRLAGTTQ